MGIKAQRGITYKKIIELGCAFLLVSSDDGVQKTMRYMDEEIQLFKLQCCVW